MTTSVKQENVVAIISGKNIIVFFQQKMTNEGDVFAPRIDFGIVELLENETPEVAARRYIQEWMKTLNCQFCGDPDSSYELKLLAFTDSPARILTSEESNEDLTRFLEMENLIVKETQLHKENHCPKNAAR